MTGEPLAAELERLRSRRVRRDRAPEAGVLFAAQARELAKQQKRLGGVAGAWAEVCPPELIERTTILSLSRGVLTIGVPDAAARFELDRFLRAGAERELIRLAPATVRTVRLVAHQGATP